MTYSSKQLNRDFRFKVFGRQDGKKINTLMGVDGMTRLLGEEMFSKLVDRAYRNINADATYCKLRRGILVTFYCK